MEFEHEEGRIFLRDASGQTIAEILYNRVSDSAVDIVRTFVDPSLQGQGIAGKLMKAVVEEVTENDSKVVATCSYAKQWFLKHPEYNYLLEVEKEE